jgi:hypothetical protein
LRSQKFGTLKYFEICGVQGKEHPVSRSTCIDIYQSDQHGQLLEAKEENIEATYIVRSTHPCNRLIDTT